MWFAGAHEGASGGIMWWVIGSGHNAKKGTVRCERLPRKGRGRGFKILNLNVNKVRRAPTSRVRTVVHGTVSGNVGFFSLYTNNTICRPFKETVGNRHSQYRGFQAPKGMSFLWFQSHDTSRIHRFHHKPHQNALVGTPFRAAP